jgi:hypothetical protein
MTTIYATVTVTETAGARATSQAAAGGVLLGGQDGASSTAVPAASASAASGNSGDYDSDPVVSSAAPSVPSATVGQTPAPSASLTDGSANTGDDDEDDLVSVCLPWLLAIICQRSRAISFVFDLADTWMIGLTILVALVRRG